jgi:hypothetical protein
MQVTQQTQQHKHIFFSGKKGIITELNNNIRARIKGMKFPRSKKTNAHITEIITSRIYTKIYIDNQDEDRQKELRIILTNQRLEVIHLMIRIGEAHFSQMIALTITDEDILYEEAIADEYRFYLLSKLAENPIFISGAIQKAKTGKYVDYTRLNKIARWILTIQDLIEELKEVKKIRDSAKPVYHPKTGERIESENIPPEIVRLELLDRVELEEDPTDEELENDWDNLSIFKLNQKWSYYRKQERKEQYRTRVEASKPQNLCHYMLYTPFKPSEIPPPKQNFEDNIFKLRKSSLMILINLFCNIHNSHYKNEIDNTTKQSKIMSYNPTKKISTIEKRELIQIGKYVGMTQIEVAGSIPCNVKTVKRNWN